MKLSTFTVREVRNRPGRAILTILSIVIGVAAVVSVSMATTTSRQAFRNMYQMISGKSTLIVTAAGGGNFDEGIAKEISKVPGVTVAAPSIAQAGNVYFPKKTHLTDDGRELPTKTQLQILGIDPTIDQKVRDFELADPNGKYFSADGEGVVLDANIAKAMNSTIGDPVEMVASLTDRGRKHEYEIVGTVPPREGGAVASGAVVFLSLPEAQRLFGAKGEINFVHIVTDDNADLDAVEKAVIAKLPPELKVDRAGVGSKSAEESILSAEQGLQLGTALSFVLAVFIILNTFLMNVSERRRQLAILRAIGATRGQIMQLLLREGLIMGVVGTVLGVALGFGGAYILTRILEGLFMTPLPSLIVTKWPFILGPSFGMGLSFIGTYFPARKAGMVSPLEGMGGSAREDAQPVPKALLFCGSLIMAVGGGLLAGCIAGVLPISMAVMSAVALMIGMVLLVPTTLGTLARGALLLLRPILKTEGRLAHGTLLRRRTRTALTVGVLFIALAMGLGLGTEIIDNVGDVQNWYRRTLSCDMVIRATMPSANGDAERMPAAFRDKIAKVAGIKQIDQATYLPKIRLDYRKGDKAETTTFTIITRRFNLSDEVALNIMDSDQKQVLQQMKAGEVVMGTVLAQRTGLKKGDEFTIDTTHGPHAFKIGALVNDYIASGMVVYFYEETARQYFNFEGVSAYLVDVEHAHLDTAAAALRKLCDKNDLILQTSNELMIKIDGIVNGAVAGQWLILVLGFTVAAIGIINTLTMNVLEQTREIGLLRIVAMTRRQVRKLVFAQAMLMGVIGLLPGIVVGIGVAYLMNLATLPVIGHPVELHWHPLMNFSCFSIGMLIVLIAAMFPAERAARIDIATALQYE